MFFDSYDVKADKDGVLKLIVKNLSLGDEAQYTCRIGDRETTCKLLVDEGTNPRKSLADSRQIQIPCIFYFSLFAEKTVRWTFKT